MKSEIDRQKIRGKYFREMFLLKVNLLVLYLHEYIKPKKRLVGLTINGSKYKRMEIKVSQSNLFYCSNRTLSLLNV